MIWSPVQKLFNAADEQENAPTVRVPPVPLRTPRPRFSEIMVGSGVLFEQRCALPQLRGRMAQVHSIRHYHFGEDVIASFRLKLNQNTHFSFSVAEDAQGQYLAMSRQLTTAEQDEWFGRDALGFFTEPSTAKTLRCKVNLEIEGAWAAPRYIKSVDWVEGNLSDGRQHTPFRYNLLLDEAGEKALEIEHYPMIEKNKIYVTVYRPITDIVEILEPTEMPAQPIHSKTPPSKPAMTMPPDKRNGHMNGHHPESLPFTPVASAAFVPSYPAGNGAKPKPDFRRAGDEDAAAEIHIHGTHGFAANMKAAEETPPLPSFLLSREHNYLSLDAVIPPETERVRCGVLAAKNIIDTALARGVRVRDVLRDIVGLDSMLSDEVVFEMPLSDHDYRVLAMRYKMRPDHREEIRARLQSELRNRLLGLPE